MWAEERDRVERADQVERAVRVERRDREEPAEAAETAPAVSSAAAVNVSTWEAINRIAACAAIIARLTSLTARPVSAGPSLVATRSTRHTPANPEASAAAETAASRTKYVATSPAQSISPAATRRPPRSQAVRLGVGCWGCACRRGSGAAAGTGTRVRADIREAWICDPAGCACRARAPLRPRGTLRPLWSRGAATPASPDGPGVARSAGHQRCGRGTGRGDGQGVIGLRLSAPEFSLLTEVATGATLTRS